MAQIYQEESTPYQPGLVPLVLQTAFQLKGLDCLALSLNEQTPKNCHTVQLVTIRCSTKIHLNLHMTTTCQRMICRKVVTIRTVARSFARCTVNHRRVWLRLIKRAVHK